MDRRFVGNVLLILVPPLALIFLVLGSIIAGIATVNQAGAIGAVGALIMAGYRLKPGRRDTFAPAILGMISLVVVLVVTSIYDTNIKNIQSTDDVIGVTLAVIAVFGLIVSIVWSGWRAYKIEDTLQGVMIDTAKTTSLVFIILLGAAMLTAAFRSFGGEELVREFLNGMPGGFWSKFVIVMAVIFVLGFFLDFIEIAVVVVPIVSPILLADPSANVTAVWLGVMIGLNIQTSFLTPPFGFALFYLRGVAPPSVKTLEMYKGVIAFIGLQLVALGIVGNYPALVNYLPNRVSLTSETAPPPLNPRLQYCMEEYIFEQFAANGGTLRAAIERARGLDYSYLPKSLQTDVLTGFEKAESAFELIATAKAAEAEIETQATDYRPLHIVVREIQNKLLIVDTKIKIVEQQLRRAEPDSPLKEVREARMDALNGEREALLATMPENWDAAHKAFLSHTKAERTARNAYRKAVDAAYEPIVELRAIIADAAALEAMGDAVTALQADVPGLEFAPAIERIKAVENRINDVAGTREINKLLAKARRAIKGKTPDAEKAAQFLSDAAMAFDAEVAWRKRADAGLKNGLAEYDAAIRDTIGLRGQSRLPKEQALYVASCSAGHKDISLSF